MSMKFSRKEYWRGCHFLLLGIFLTQGSNLHLLHWQVDSLTTEPPGKPLCGLYLLIINQSATKDILNIDNKNEANLAWNLGSTLYNDLGEPNLNFFDLWIRDNIYSPVEIQCEAQTQFYISSSHSNKKVNKEQVKLILMVCFI